MSTNLDNGLLAADVIGQHPIQYPAGIAVQDGALVPVVSPKTGITTAQMFTPPSGAVAMIFQASAACRYGDNRYLDGTAAGKGYKSGGALTDTSVPCANNKPIFIAAETGTIAVDFLFEMMN
jgi:hypothetical protein